MYTGKLTRRADAFVNGEAPDGRPPLNPKTRERIGQENAVWH
jgi:hypothetical protein